MEELDLLEALHVGRKELKELKLSLIPAQDDLARQAIENDVKTSEKKLKEITGQLRLITSSEDSHFAWRQMCLRLQEYSAAIRAVTSSHMITRNQGLIFDNRLFGIIMGELRSFAEGKKVVQDSIDNLHYSTESNKAILKDAFADFLDREAASLTQIDSINFPDLEEFAVTFVSRAINCFQSES